MSIIITITNAVTIDMMIVSFKFLTSLLERMFMEQQLITIATAAGTTLVTKGISAPIESFNDLWNGAIGHRIKAWSEERKIKVFENVNKLKEDIAKNLNSIPQENLKDPDASIVGPALEAAKYYCDEDVLRQMFARVISSNMDNRISPKVHQSFVEIIKQLSSKDATLLKLFIRDTRLPIANIALVLNPDGTIPLFEFYFIDPRNPGEDSRINAISISNLIRLGLLTTPGELSSFTNKDKYRHLDTGDLYTFYKNKFPIGSPFESFTVKEVNLVYSYVGLTPYGVSFVDICVE